MFPIFENSDVKNICETINFKYPSFSLYVCHREKYIYTSQQQDTLIAVVELKIRLHFTDTSAYFMIEEINKLTTEMIIFDKDEEKEFINEMIFKMMKNSKFYYEGRKNELQERSYYMNIPIRFIPCK